MSSDLSKVTYPLVKDLIDPTESEIEQVVTVLIDAFDGDPFTSILLGGHLELAHAELLANVRAALIGGQVHVITVGPSAQDIIGVAVWYPPGSSVFASEEERSVGWNQFLETVPLWLKNWWMDYFIPTVSQLSARALGPQYSLNAWHLHLFGVMKKHHRKGYGKAVFRFAEERVSAACKPIMVETTTEVDVEIYTKLGFRTVGKTGITSPIANANMWLMVKEPQGSE
ncbi:hypothetical protein D9613_008620 [Agrocybe pediades]|uniref:N-acetyltransferase domain-containing protein n=1 Tax=Agrocybe pediades TaxID=84607 RepID=A0A8H4QTI7_9AGAR|nr:hypothetical protein D9613_008620 [Agrocybe pediades]